MAAAAASAASCSDEAGILVGDNMGGVLRGPSKSAKWPVLLPFRPGPEGKSVGAFDTTMTRQIGVRA